MYWQVSLLSYHVAFIAEAAVANTRKFRSHQPQLGLLEIWKYWISDYNCIFKNTYETYETRCFSLKYSLNRYSGCVMFQHLLAFVKVSKAVVRTRWQTVSVLISHQLKVAVLTFQFELFLDHEHSMIEDANKCKQ